MIKVGYSCITNIGEIEIDRAKTFPFTVKHPAPGQGEGRIGTFTSVGPAGDDYTIVERWRIEKPSRSHTRGVETQSVINGQMIVDPHWVAFSVVKVRKRLKQMVSDEAEEIIVTRFAYYKQVQALLNGATVSSPMFVKITSVTDHADALRAELDALTTISGLDAWEPHDWPVI